MVEYNTRIQYIKGVGETRAKDFSKLGIFSVGSLLRYYPRCYEDWSNITKISDAHSGDTVCLKATVLKCVNEVQIKGGRIISKTSVSDDSGIIALVFFNNKYIKNTLRENENYLFYGKISDDKNGGLMMIAPRIEKSPEKQRIRPIYGATASLSSKSIERITETALKEIKGNIREIIPEYILDKYHLMPLEETLNTIHFPENEVKLSQAKRRLIFEELLVLQLGLLTEKNAYNKRKNEPIVRNYTEEFFSMLPFDPTNAQKRAIDEAVKDMMSDRAMSRLLQGDVGSGKTAVAAALIYTAAKNGTQSVLMAPTEVLANQHIKTLKEFFGDKLKIELLTGSVTAANKRRIKEEIENGYCDVVVGTHAVIQDSVIFKSLSLVITDEQHRFGVAQRAALAAKGNNPNVLVMSATPIPRTLAMIIYGDLDVSVLDELPKGRQPVRTYSVNTSYRQRIYEFLKKTINSGHQCYIVCPLVEEGKNESDLVPATEYYNYLKTNYFQDYNLGLLHGAMKPKDKDDIMHRFYNGEIQLLVSTVVIEVGVDVPNATVMIIENAERFGLSQLHQLRGRIGRGSDESTCVLLSDAQNKEAVERLKILCETTDGFKISQYDLELRGPGDFFGSRQHGLPDMHIANLMTDTRILYEAQKVAKEITDTDPFLVSPENTGLKDEIKRLFENASI